MLFKVDVAGDGHDWVEVSIRESTPVLATGFNDPSSHISGDFDNGRNLDLILFTPMTWHVSFLLLRWGCLLNYRYAVSGSGGLRRRAAIFFLARGDQSIAGCVIDNRQVYVADVEPRPVSLGDFLDVSLEANTDEVPFNFFFELTSDLLKETGPFVLLALALEVFPLQATLDLSLVNGKEIYAVPL